MKLHTYTVLMKSLLGFSLEIRVMHILDTDGTGLLHACVPTQEVWQGHKFAWNFPSYKLLVQTLPGQNISLKPTLEPKLSWACKEPYAVL